MRFESATVRNFKSFYDSGEMFFDPGINLIVGPNSVGKSALLEALSGRMVGVPHRSLRTIERVGDVEIPNSEVEVGVACSARGLRQQFMRSNGYIYFPFPPGLAHGQPISLRLINQFFALETVHLGLVSSVGRGASTTFSGCQNKSTGLDGNLIVGAPNGFVACEPTRNHREVNADSIRFDPHGTRFDVIAGTVVNANIFRFSAERMNIASSTVGVATTLAPNAANLPEVLDNLMSNRHLYDEYLALVSEVLPVVRAVTVKASNDRTVQIRVWHLPQESRRDDLTVPLDQCGTGVSQVLALLYVVLFSSDPQIILIDEPNSFLHPGASRALVQVLKRFPHHQYIVATHATEVIAESGAARAIRVEWRDGESTCTDFSSDETKRSRVFLQDVGARLSDVFGFNKVLWTEGPSDAQCISAILRAESVAARGLAVVPVHDTNSYSARKAAEIVGIYRQASMISALVPPSIGFLLDREGRTDADIEEVGRTTDFQVRFLARRMIENYLFNTEAIAAVLSDLDVYEGVAVEARQIQDWIVTNGRAKSFMATQFAPFSDDWLRAVHGGNLMSALFSSITNARVEYRKTRDCLALTEKLLERSPEFLRPLRDAFAPFL